jgi:threonine/homoserine/homoserine lactone efflux protein
MRRLGGGRGCDTAGMVTTSQLLAFGLAAFVIIVIPGPSVLFVIGRALSYGRGVALLSVLGNSLGLLTVMVLVAVGLGAVVAESLLVFTVIKLAGAAYMIWLGVQALQHRRAMHVTDPGAADAPPMAGWLAVRQGFLVGVSNPKAFMMFAAVLPQFIVRSSGDVTQQMLLLGLLAFVIGLLSDGVWALLASKLREWFNRSPRRGRALGAVGGTSMIGLGVALAATGRPD